jgi:uncharacterized NAD(P)/FAD-binding protein YdhS
MKKTLNANAVANELRGESAFFPKPSPPPAVVEEAPVGEPFQGERPKESTNVRTNERTNARKKVRHTFDIYQDQLLSLREFALNREMVFGERVLLGDLVQEALDMFITKERNNE